jgi:hypothetical protein
MSRFLESNLNYNLKESNTDIFSNNLHNLQKSNTLNFNLNIVNNINTLLEFSNEFNTKQLINLLVYPNLLLEINDDTDKTMILLPIRKLLNSFVTKNNLINYDHLINFTNNNSSTSNSLSFVETNLLNQASSTKVFKPVADSQSVLPSDQSVRKFTKLNPSGTNYNLSLGLNSLDSNLRSSSNSIVESLLKTYSNTQLNWVDSAISQKLSNNAFFFEAPYSPIVSNNPFLSTLNYDSTILKTLSYKSTNNKVVLDIASKGGDAVNILSGRRDNALKALSTAY